MKMDLDSTKSTRIEIEIDLKLTKNWQKIGKKLKKNRPKINKKLTKYYPKID